MKNTLHKRAFTIVEVLIGITVISLTIVSITGLVVRTIQVNTANMNSFVASQLAQEGLEITRNMRDSNWMRNLDWLGSKQPRYIKYGANFDASNEKQYFLVDYNRTYPVMNHYLANDSDVQLDGGNFPWSLIGPIGVESIGKESRLYQCADSQKGAFYIHDTKKWDCEQPSLYNRYISIQLIPVDEYDGRNVIARVHSVVEWEEHTGKKRVDLAEDFTDWRRGPL